MQTDSADFGENPRPTVTVRMEEAEIRVVATFVAAHVCRKARAARVLVRRPCAADLTCFNHANPMSLYGKNPYGLVFFAGRKMRPP